MSGLNGLTRELYEFVGQPYDSLDKLYDGRVVAEMDFISCARNTSSVAKTRTQMIIDPRGPDGDIQTLTDFVAKKEMLESAISDLGAKDRITSILEDDDNIRSGYIPLGVLENVARYPNHPSFGTMYPMFFMGKDGSLVDGNRIPQTRVFPEASLSEKTIFEIMGFLANRPERLQTDIRKDYIEIG